MKTQQCCAGVRRASAESSTPASSPWRRGGKIGSWLVSGAAFVLVPKCPACLAAYVALVSGIGISITTATYLRSSMLVLSATALLFLALQALCRFCVRRPA